MPQLLMIQLSLIKMYLKNKKKDIKEIPMIFGSSVGYETLENYPGKISYDNITRYSI